MRHGQLLWGAIFLSAVTAWVGDRTKVSPSFIEAIVAAIFGAYPIVAESVEARLKSRPERIQDFVTGDVYQSPVMTLFFVIFAVQFVERVSGALLGAAVGTALGLIRRPDVIVPVTLFVTPPFVVLISGFLIVPIAKYAAHRIRRFAFAWIVGGIVVNAFLVEPLITLSFLVMVLKLPAPALTKLLPAQAQFVAALLPGTAIGYLWARKTQVAFAMSRLFAQLSHPDQAAVMDLLRQSPVQTNAPQSVS